MLGCAKAHPLQLLGPREEYLLTRKSKEIGTGDQILRLGKLGRSVLRPYGRGSGVLEFCEL
jgi:hypothetical protein